MPREKRLSIFIRKGSTSGSAKDVTEPANEMTRKEFVKLVKSRQWSEVLNHLPQNPDFAKSMDGTMPLLHEVCRYQPPLRVIQEFVHIDPELVTVMSTKNHAPLHVACRCGAPPDVINFLCQVSPTMAGLQDYNGRTPLHLLCQEYAIHYNEEQRLRISLSKALIAAVKMLLVASPNTVNTEDKDGKTALHYAVDDQDIDIRVLHCIQKASAKDMTAKNNDKVSPAAPASAAAGGRRRRSLIEKFTTKSPIQKQIKNDVVAS